VVRHDLLVEMVYPRSKISLSLFFRLREFFDLKKYVSCFYKNLVWIVYLVVLGLLILLVFLLVLILRLFLICLVLLFLFTFTLLTLYLLLLIVFFLDFLDLRIEVVLLLLGFSDGCFIGIGLTESTISEMTSAYIKEILDSVRFKKSNSIVSRLLEPCCLE
jgi:hypothetical protein